MLIHTIAIATIKAILTVNYAHKYDCDCNQFLANWWQRKLKHLENYELWQRKECIFGKFGKEESLFGSFSLSTTLSNTLNLISHCVHSVGFKLDSSGVITSH